MDSPTYQLKRDFSLSLPSPHTVLDIAVTDQALFALATTQPDEWAMEAESNVVLHHSFSSSKPSLITLRGRGLPDEHGIGAWLARPRRIIACHDAQHFLIVADRAPPAWIAPSTALPTCDDDVCIACDGSTALEPTGPRGDDVPQIALYRLDDGIEANAQHYLELRSALTAELRECDLAVGSVQVAGETVVAFVRWRDPEEVFTVHSGRAGKAHFLDLGWRAVEVVAWTWRDGASRARIRLEGVKEEAPLLTLTDDSKLTVIVATTSYRETAVYDLEKGGQRIDVQRRQLDGDDEGVDLGFAEASTHQPIKRRSAVVMGQDVKLRSTFDKIKLDGSLRLRCSSGDRSIYALDTSRSPLQPTTVFGVRKRVPHYLVKAAPRSNKRDSGFSDDADQLRNELNVEEIVDERLRAILAKKQVWMGGDRVVTVDEEGLRVLGVEL